MSLDSQHDFFEQPNVSLYTNKMTGLDLMTSSYPQNEVFRAALEVFGPKNVALDPQNYIVGSAK